MVGDRAGGWAVRRLVHKDALARVRFAKGRMTPITIAIVDDHRVVTRSLQMYLESFPDLRIVGVAATGEELLAHLREWRPQVVLQDLILPGGLDGIETTK